MSNANTVYEGAYQVRQNPLTEFLLETFSKDLNVVLPDHLSAKEAAVVTMLQTYDNDQRESVLSFVQNYGAPNALPSLEQLNQSKHRDIALAFGPVAIACLEGILEEPHKIHTLWHVNQCAEEQPHKLPLLYRFLTLCLELHIFSLEGLLKWKNLPTTIKRALASRKMQQELGSYSASNSSDLRQSIMHLLSPERHPNSDSIHGLHSCWFSLNNQDLKTLGTFCASWYEQKCAESTPNDHSGDKLEIAAAQYLHHISQLPAKVIDFLKTLHASLQPNSNTINVQLPALPKLDELPPPLQDTLVETFAFLQISGRSLDPYAFESCCLGLGEAFLQDLYQNHILRYINAAFKDLTPREHESVRQLVIILANVIGRDFIGENASKQRMNAAEQLIHPIHAEACLHIWQKNYNTPLHAVSQLSTLLNVSISNSDSHEDARRAVAKALFNALEAGTNFQIEYTQIISGILSANAPEVTTAFSETLAKTLAADLEIILQGSTHPQTQKCLVENWQKGWKSWVVKHADKLKAFFSTSADTSLYDQARAWLDNPQAHRSGLDAASGYRVNGQFASFHRGTDETISGNLPESSVSATLVH